MEKLILFAVLTKLAFSASTYAPSNVTWSDVGITKDSIRLNVTILSNSSLSASNPAYITDKPLINKQTESYLMPDITEQQATIKTTIENSAASLISLPNLVSNGTNNNSLATTNGMLISLPNLVSNGTNNNSLVTTNGMPISLSNNTYNSFTNKPLNTNISLNNMTSNNLAVMTSPISTQNTDLTSKHPTTEISTARMHSTLPNYNKTVINITSESSTAKQALADLLTSFSASFNATLYASVFNKTNTDSSATTVKLTNNITETTMKPITETTDVKTTENEVTTQKKSVKRVSFEEAFQQQDINTLRILMHKLTEWLDQYSET